VYDALGDKAQALQYYEQALPIQRQVGDRWGESVTCFNIGMIYANLGDLARAEQMLMRTVELDEAIGHPDLASDRAVLEQVRSMMRGEPQPARNSVEDEEQSGGNPLGDLLRMVRQARDGDRALGGQIKPSLVQLAGQPDGQPQIRALAQVLLQLLAGEAISDLSALPPEFAAAVAAAFDLPAV
jgi:tetratricopeptide (TPR) repeat protein